MNSIRQFVDRPQPASRCRWRQVDSPVGLLRALIPPAMHGTDSQLGEHTRQILPELAIDEATIDARYRHGVDPRLQ